MVKKEKNWLQILSDKKKSEYDEMKNKMKMKTLMKRNLGEKMKMNKMKKENNTEEKKRGKNPDSLKKNLKYAKEVSTPKKKILTIEKMMKRQQNNEKEDEKNKVMKMIEKFENIGAKVRNKVDCREKEVTLDHNESMYDEKKVEIEYGSQTKDEKELKRTFGFKNKD